MKNKFFIVLCFSITLFLKSESYELYEKLSDSTVRISIWENYDTEESEKAYYGSGVFLNKVNGKVYILTNAHVVVDKYELFDDITTYLDDSFTIVIDTIESNFEYIVSYDQIIYWTDADLAIIVLDEEYYDNLSNENFRAIEVYDGYAAPLLDVYVAGFPAVAGNHDDYPNMFVDRCVINSYVLDLEAVGGGYEIIHDCAVSGGMSGGPLVDSRGKLIGINGLGWHPIFEQGRFGKILDTDFDATQYHYSVDIWRLYLFIGTSQDEWLKNNYFDKNSYFYKFLPQLNYSDHKEMYHWIRDELIKDTERNQMINFFESAFKNISYPSR